MECFPELRGINKLLRFEITQNFELTTYWEHNQDIFLSQFVLNDSKIFFLFAKTH